MIFLGLEKIDNKKARIGVTHYFPEQLTDEILATGILVDEEPKPENIQGKYAVAYYDYETKTVYYEYEDIPLTEAEILKKRIDEQEAALVELASMLGGAN